LSPNLVTRLVCFSRPWLQLSKKFTPDLASEAKKKIFNTVMVLEAINRRPSRLPGYISTIDYDSSSSYASSSRTQCATPVTVQMPQYSTEESNILTEAFAYALSL
jgi:hypothetical protein